MRENEQLAIIIPAYKSTFLKEALDSIASQTCKNFTLYIGDDCSPYNLENIVDDYRGRIGIIYKRFDNNLGGKDLVAQWERCIAMSHDEPYIWLFSDDDVMDVNCVEMFYETIKQNPNAGLFRFNINKINGASRLVSSFKSWPKYCSTKEYIDGKLGAKGYISFVVEFIVRRDIYTKCGGFENFDLAWGSDFISWVKFSDAANGIVTIDNAKVNWRESDENISPNKNPEIIYRKLKSVILYTKWISDYARGKNYGNRWFYSKYALGELKRNKNILSKTNLDELVAFYSQINNLNLFYFNLLKFLYRYCL